MSVVIAAKYKDGVALASDKQCTEGNIKNNNVTKIHKFKYSNTGIGTVGYLRDCNLMNIWEEIIPFKDILDKVEINEDYVIKTVVSNIKSYLNSNKRLKEEESEMESTMIFVTPNEIYEIGGDFSVVTSDNSFMAIGCGRELATGFMTSLGDTKDFSEEQIKEALINAIKKGCESDAFVNDRVSIALVKKNG